MLNAPLGIGHVWGAFPVRVVKHKDYSELRVLFLDIQMLISVLSGEQGLAFHKDVLTYLEIRAIAMNHHILKSLWFIFQVMIAVEGPLNV